MISHKVQALIQAHCSKISEMLGFVHMLYAASKHLLDFPPWDAD